MDEVFGSDNFVSQIAFKRSGATSEEVIAGVADHIIWFARNKSSMKARRLFQAKSEGGSAAQQYSWLRAAEGTLRRATRQEIQDPASALFRPVPLTSQRSAGSGDLKAFVFEGVRYTPGSGTFKSDERGLAKLAHAYRLVPAGKSLSYVMYMSDYPVYPFTNLWDDTMWSGFAEEKTYVVQTNTKVIARCLLMCTDPGDLVLDPTCGSGTTANVAEQWGRRWITIDTSRVALALARQRLMGAKYPFYLLADSDRGKAKETELSGIRRSGSVTNDIRHGFVYERVQHITLKSTANNPDIFEGMTRADIDAAIKRHAEFEVLLTGLTRTRASSA